MGKLTLLEELINNPFFRKFGGLIFIVIGLALAGAAIAGRYYVWKENNKK